jgi:hypothetical protein
VLFATAFALPAGDSAFKSPCVGLLMSKLKQIPI